MPRATAKRSSQRVAKIKKEAAAVVAPKKADEEVKLRNTVAQLKKKLGKEEAKHLITLSGLNSKVRDLEYSLENSKWNEDYYKRRFNMLEKEMVGKEKIAQKIKEKMEKDLKKANDSINSLKACKSTVKAQAMVTKATRQLNISRDKMLEAQKLLREGQEAREGNKKPWKSCEICGDEYTDTADKCPRVLGCGHTVCTSCVKEMLDGDHLRCPFDRQFFHVGRNNVEKLPKNYTLLHM